MYSLHHEHSVILAHRAIMCSYMFPVNIAQQFVFPFPNTESVQCHLDSAAVAAEVNILAVWYLSQWACRLELSSFCSALLPAVSIGNLACLWGY